MPGLFLFLGWLGKGILLFWNPINILSTHNAHNLDGIPNNPVVNTVDATNAPPISWPDMINSLVSKWLAGYKLKLIKEFEKIFISLRFSEFAYAILVNADKIVPGILAESIFPHCDVILPWIGPGFRHGSDQ